MPITVSRFRVAKFGKLAHRLPTWATLTNFEFSLTGHTISWCFTVDEGSCSENLQKVLMLTFT